MLKKQSEKNILSLILSGKHPKAKKFAGRHVLVIENKIIPLKKGKGAIKDIEFLEKKYGKTPTIVFIPRQDISYILRESINTQNYPLKLATGRNKYQSVS